ncbi:hypothetical protein [Patulibacter sp.]|uniref:hypothetical protein n=1 Tax=Patulibacter sp. TaxID=1912859 RepID=UPI0027219F5C|nr:hypothetical protein [Patulibacter sp.]MDO9407852.1 hypothetical protein [Patulibacter sp.]
MNTGKPTTRRFRNAAIVAALGVAVPLSGAAAAQAYEITDFSANIVKQDGTTFETQAGGHPYQGIIDFNTKKTAVAPTGPAGPANQPGFLGGNNEGQTKTIRVDTPPGLVPNPESVPKCTVAQLHATPVACPPSAQIGRVQLRLSKIVSDGSFPTAGPPPAASPTNPFNLQAGSRADLELTVPLYNVVPEEGELAHFGFNPKQTGGPTASGEVVDIIGDMRPGDNGLAFTINNVTRPTPADPTAPTLTGSTLTFWGTPGDASHTPERGAATLRALSLGGGFKPSAAFPAFLATPVPGGQPSTTGNAAFLSSPTSCSGPQTATLTLDSYQGDRRVRDFLVAKDTNGVKTGLEGCDLVPFGSATTFGASSLQRDAPTPLAVQLDVPQSTDSGTLATAHVKRVAVQLPPGMTISPSAANGLQACQDAQFNKGNTNPISCPASSRIGAVKITTPVLDSPLNGSVYVGEPLPGNRYRLFVNADGHGISIRLKGTVTPDPNTGQVSAVFDDNPQLPFSQFRLDFDGGSKAIIASPQTCGAVTGTGTLSPWSGTAASTTSSTLTVQNCAGNPFGPVFQAALSNGNSGKYAPFSVAFLRNDGDQFLSGLKATLPQGMTAKIKGVTQCTDAQIAAEACPASSRIATVKVQAGPGAAPYALSGPAYLTGSYKGGAFGTVAIIRAVAGPYDLGNVVVRQALRIDPETAQVTVDSDPLPQIKEGILLRLRNLTLDVDRPNFLRNPTSCGTQKITTTVTGNAGTAVNRDAGLSFNNCKALPFRPKISLKFGNKTQMKKDRHPQVVAKVTQFESEAGIKSTQVALPKQVALQASNAQALCEKADAAKDACPKKSIIGSAKATTTILNRQLTAPIYFVKGTRTTAAGKEVATLPTLYIPLDGEARVNLRAVTSVSRNRLVTTFPSIPDQPITSFELKIDGGKNGIIAATTNLCTAKEKASSRFVSWSGKKAPTRKTKITTSCSKAKKK